jgi:nucleoside-diphosphate-sugar epimerase
MQASGNLGRVIIPKLLLAGFHVTVIARPGSKPFEITSDGGVEFGSKVVDTKVALYSDLSSMSAALAGQHAVVETFNPAAAGHQQIIVQAALAAGVVHFITPDFSSDTFNQYADELFIFEPKLRAQVELEETIKSSPDKNMAWTALIVGPWYDWAIDNGQFWIDKSTRTITKFGSGTQHYSMSPIGLCGDAVVEVLQRPEKYKNRPAYFASVTVTTNQLIAMVEEISDGGWKVQDVQIDGFMQEGRELWIEDTKKGVEDRLRSRAYPMLGTAAIFDEDNRYGANFGDKIEPGWGGGLEGLKAHLTFVLG